jgi:hypothetical protein
LALLASVASFSASTTSCWLALMLLCHVLLLLLLWWWCGAGTIGRLLLLLLRSMAHRPDGGGRSGRANEVMKLVCGCVD